MVNLGLTPNTISSLHQRQTESISLYIFVDMFVKHSPGISPGAAAPPVGSSWSISSGDIVSVHAAIGLRGLRVHEGIHLFTPDLF